MSVQTRFGSFGTCVKKNGTNNYTVLQPADKTKNSSDWQFENSLGDRAPAWIDNSMKLDLPAEQTEVRPVDHVYDADFKNVNFNTDVLYSNMPQTTDETNTMNKNATGITQYAMSSFATWVTKGGVEKGWDAYVNKLNQNKLRQQVQIEQKIYDRFSGNLKKSGVDLTKILNW
jgi:putative aldouronate transport system substrate-binding protein